MLENNIRYTTVNTTTNNPPLISGKGCMVMDINGKKYIDGCSQTLNLVLGQCNKAINKAVIEQLNKITFTSSRFSNKPANDLAEKLIKITPKDLNRVNLKMTSGSLANEGAIKAARKFTGKNIIISVNNSHHGQTIGTMEISGKHWNIPYIKNRKAVFLSTPVSEDIENNLNKELEKIIKEYGDDLAGFIIEPIMVDAGVVVPSQKYHLKIRHFCDTYNIPLIYDEIQTAFGWLGNIFASDFYGVVPDIMTLGKGLGAGFPLSAMLLNEKYDVLNYGEHEITYGAHPVSCVASMALIDILENTNILSEVKEKGIYIKEQLLSLAKDNNFIKNITGEGLIIGIELDNSNDSNIVDNIISKMLDLGVILRKSKVGANSHVIQFKPPIIISYSEINEILNKLEYALKYFIKFNNKKDNFHKTIKVS